MENFWYWSKNRIASLVIAVLNLILAFSMSLPLPFQYYLGKSWVVVLVLEVAVALPLIWFGFTILGWLILLLPDFCWIANYVLNK